MTKPFDTAEVVEIQGMAQPLSDPRDLRPLVERVGDARFVCIGEASHGTHEYYAWRGEISRRLIMDKGFDVIGVEGDWPDCWRLNQWVRGDTEARSDAREILASFQRWPTWMWANEEIADFLDWLRSYNATRPSEHRVGFYGLDVYSLWDSLRVVFGWLERNAPTAVPAARRAWSCFMPYGEDPHEYGWSTRLVPESCEREVVDLLLAVRRHAARELSDDAAFDAWQNAEVAVDAERYYREMVRSDRGSWNIRDLHMVGALDRLTLRAGPGSKALVWAHNTHVGDARATTMATQGMVNVGQIMRERHEQEGVVLVGFAGHRGEVIAGAGWGAPEQALFVPPARSGSHEDLLHRALGRPATLIFPPDRTGPWLRSWAGHRAIGVVYRPSHEEGNYVSTVMGQRYDALLWLETTTALRPLHHERPPSEPEFETEPSGL
jgi:erythromycin esterase